MHHRSIPPLFCVRTILILAAGFAGRCIADTPDRVAVSEFELSAQGWIDLPATTPLAQWVRVPLPTTKPLVEKSPWSYEPATGILSCAATGIHEMLLHPAAQADGVLHVEWRYVGTPPKPNSGVFVRTRRDNSVWYQAQLAVASVGVLFGSSPGADGKPVKLMAGAKRPDLVRPPGEWNVTEITCRAATASLWFNGVVVAETDALTDLAGLVGLEAEGAPIEFRRMLFKPDAAAVAVRRSLLDGHAVLHVIPAITLTEGATIRAGRLGLQFEGAEVLFRDIEIGRLAELSVATSTGSVRSLRFQPHFP